MSPSAGDRDRLAADLRTAYDTDSNAAKPKKRWCECGHAMDAHAGGWVLLHHDLFIVDRLADRLIALGWTRLDGGEFSQSLASLRVLGHPIEDVIRWKAEHDMRLPEGLAAERARIRAAVEEMACECTDHSRCTPECEPASEVPTAVVLAILDTDA